MRVNVRVVTSRAQGDDSSGEVTPKLPARVLWLEIPRSRPLWRRGPKAAAPYRTSGLCRQPAGDGKHSMWDVFPGTDGQPLTRDRSTGTRPATTRAPARRSIPATASNKARHQIGRPDFRFHDLRHFAATMAAISGATTKELMQFAGHSDIHCRYALPGGHHRPQTRPRPPHDRPRRRLCRGIPSGCDLHW